MSEPASYALPGPAYPVSGRPDHLPVGADPLPGDPDPLSGRDLVPGRIYAVPAHSHHLSDRAAGDGVPDPDHNLSAVAYALPGGRDALSRRSNPVPFVPYPLSAGPG